MRSNRSVARCEEALSPLGFGAQQPRRGSDRVAGLLERQRVASYRRPLAPSRTRHVHAKLDLSPGDRVHPAWGVFCSIRFEQWGFIPRPALFWCRPVLVLVTTARGRVTRRRSGRHELPLTSTCVSMMSGPSHEECVWTPAPESSDKESARHSSREMSMDPPGSAGVWLLSDW